MMKTKKILESLVEAQKNINENLIKLNKSIEDIAKPKLEKIGLDFKVMSDRFSAMETNIYTKDQTIEKINQEYDYRKEYEECKEKNEHLLYIIEKYCRYENKYEVLKIFNEINKEYGIIKRG